MGGKVHTQKKDSFLLFKRNRFFFLDEERGKYKREIDVCVCFRRDKTLTNFY